MQGSIWDAAHAALHCSGPFRGPLFRFGDLFDQLHLRVDALEQRTASATYRSIGHLPDEPAHPFMAGRSATWRFADSWFSRLGSGGNHTDHVHPHGWLSLAYHVAVPDGVSREGTLAGWLQFGERDFDVGLVDPGPFRIKLKPGRPLLFPVDALARHRATR